MTKPLDEADRAKAGILGHHAADTVPITAEGKPDPFAAHWRSLADAGIDLARHPPARTWLLKQGTEGALPLGKCGVLAAGGGTGKTMALVQLALAVALGDEKVFWLDTFKVETPGDVLLALAEEDADEVHRRFYRAACAMGLDRNARAEAAKRIVALPLAGTPVALTARDDDGNIGETPILEALRRRLHESGREWRLIVLDPLSRWAGDDTEKDNAAATRFVQAVETLVTVPGTPAVLVAHHSAKAAASEGEANVRGASGLVDGFRWAATLDRVTAELPDGGKLEGVRWRLAKTNYTRRLEDVFLRFTDEKRDGEGMGGALVKALPNEAEALANPSKKPSSPNARKGQTTNGGSHGRNTLADDVE